VTPREAIIRAADMCLAQGSRPNYVLMNARDFNALEEWQWSWGVSEAIERGAPTYHARTTLLSQMRAAWRMAGRRGQRFDAREWWKGRQA